MANENYPFNIVYKVNEYIQKFGYKIRILLEEDGYFYSVEIVKIDENDNIIDIDVFAENMFENELEDCVNYAYANTKVRIKRAKEEKKKQEREKWLQETIALLSADLFTDIYSPDNGMGYSETASEIISLAERFEKELDWQGPDVEQRDFILELEKFENKILKEREPYMNLKRLLQTGTDCRFKLETAILQFVKEHGDDVTDYEINEFGLGEREDEGTITKVWNFFDNGGCHFNEDDCINSETLENIDDENWYEKLYEGMTHTAYQCLYVVVDKEGNEHLKYYRFYNGGVTFDDDQAEPDHGYVNRLTLVDLNYIIEAIRIICEK